MERISQISLLSRKPIPSDFGFFRHFSLNATNWFQGSALEPAELQALPAEPRSIRSRPSLLFEAEQAEPGLCDK